MKKIGSILMIVVASLFLFSCNGGNDDNTLSVVFYTGPGASFIPTQYDIEVNSKITEPEEPTSAAGDFGGWFKEVGLVNPWVFETDTVSKSTTLYAKWTYYNFTITYDLRGGVWPDGMPAGTYRTSYKYIDEFNFPTNVALYPKSPKGDPENPYKGLFLGWWTEPNLTAAQRKDPPKTEGVKLATTGDLTFYAYYSQEK